MEDGTALPAREALHVTSKQGSASSFSATQQALTECWFLALSLKTYPSVATSHSTTHPAGDYVRKAWTVVHSHNPTLCNCVKGSNTIRAKKNCLSLEIVLLTIPWDFWPDHYFEVQIFYHILFVDKVGKCTANISKFVSIHYKTGQRNFFSTCISKLRTIWMLIGSMHKIGLSRHPFPMLVHICG